MSKHESQGDYRNYAEWVHVAPFHVPDGAHECMRMRRDAVLACLVQARKRTENALQNVKLGRLKLFSLESLRAECACAW